MSAKYVSSDPNNPTVLADMTFGTPRKPYQRTPGDFAWFSVMVSASSPGLLSIDLDAGPRDGRDYSPSEAQQIARALIDAGTSLMGLAVADESPRVLRRPADVDTQLRELDD